MNKLLLSLFFCTLLMTSCKKDEVVEKRTYEYFSANLKTGMDFNAIKATFDNPDNDMGSGIHIYVYKLIDSTEIRIGYNDHIVYARHVDANGQLLHSII